MNATVQHAKATSHLAIFLAFVHDRMAVHFPYDRRTKRKPWLREPTWELLGDRSDSKKVVRNYNFQKGFFNIL